MSPAFFSQSWYRVANLRLRLRSHAQMHRQRFRGSVWHVLQDHQTGRFHRLSRGAHLLISLLDGRRTVNEAWEITSGRLGDDPPGQDEVIQLLSQLHQADLLTGELPPDLDELARRSERQQRRRLWTQIRSPLAIRLPVLDPDRFLAATARLAAPFFSRIGLAVWLALVGSGLVLAVQHWSELTLDLTDRVLAPSNLLRMLLLYPLIKALHELGHGYAVRRWGGEVHELGIMLLVLMPVPYVDASASIAFRSRWQRAAVAGAGIMVELAIAALALLLWTQVEPGEVHALAFSTLLIAGVSTLLVNGNPLLRFDGYYVLCDLLDIPNLGPRSNQYLAWVLQHHLLGMRDLPSPHTAVGERAWFVAYGSASFTYRVLIVSGIALLLVSRLMILGVVLAALALITMFAVPLAKGIVFVATDPRLRHHRGRAVGRLLAVAVVAGVILGVISAPRSTVSEGVVWLPPNAAVRAATEGVVKSLLVESGAQVREGDALVELADPVLQARIRVLEAERAELRQRIDATRFDDRVQADLFRAQLEHTDAALGLAEQLAAGLTIRAPRDGRFVLIEPRDLPERFVERGAQIGYVLGDASRVVRVVVDQDDVDLVRNRTRSVAVRFAEDLSTVASASIEREVPAASRDLPGGALGTPGGGSRTLDPTRPDRPTSFESFFQFDLRVSDGFPTETVGGRAHVRFDHGYEPIAQQTVRALRQLFLRRLGI